MALAISPSRKIMLAKRFYKYDFAPVRPLGEGRHDRSNPVGCQAGLSCADCRTCFRLVSPIAFCATNYRLMV